MTDADFMRAGLDVIGGLSVIVALGWAWLWWTR